MTDDEVTETRRLVLAAIKRGWIRPAESIQASNQNAPTRSASATPFVTEPSKLTGQRQSVQGVPMPIE